MLESNKKLIKDVKVILSDLELALHDIKDHSSKELTDFQDTLTQKLASAKEMLIDSEQDLLNKERLAMEMTDGYVRDNAWKFAIIGAVLGFLIGYTV